MREPQDVNAPARVFLCAPDNVLHRKIADLNFDGDRHAVNLGAYIRPHVAKGQFQLHVADMRYVLERKPNLRFAESVRFAFAKVIQARSLRRMSEMIKPTFAFLRITGEPHEEQQNGPCVFR